MHVLGCANQRMTSLDLDAALQDQRLAPLLQLVALRALDRLFTPSDFDVLVMSRMYRAALAPSFGEDRQTDFGLLCTTILSDMGVADDTSRFAEADAALTPAFITRSSDVGGFLAHRRLLLQLREQLRVLQCILSQSPLHK